MLQKENHTVFIRRREGVRAVPKGASSTHLFEYSVRSRRAIWEATSLPGDGRLVRVMKNDISEIPSSGL